MVVKTAVDPSIQIKATVKIRGVETAPAAVDIDTSRLQIAPGMRVAAHQSKRQMIGEPVIDSQVDPTGGELIAVGIKIRIDMHKIAKAGRPEIPAVLPHRRKHRRMLGRL